MRPTTTLHIPEPCAESWDAMTPVGAGRHCAACAKTVVDFTLSTDAEILAYLARAAGGRTCGRFAAGQLARPLQRAALVAPTARWRAWLAAAGALWAVREGVGSEAKAQAATEWSPRYWGGPVPTGSAGAAVSTTTSPKTPATAMPAEKKWIVRGVVRDSAEHLGLPGTTVLVKNTQIGISTDKDGAFELAVPAEFVHEGLVEIEVKYIGYVSQQRLVAVGAAAPAQRFYLEGDVKGLMGVVVTAGLIVQRPLPWHPRALYGWSKYWLGRAFRR